jgi:hypothetical protein
MDDPNTGELEIKRHRYCHFINVDILLYVDTLIHHCRVLKVVIRCHIARPEYICTKVFTFSQALIDSTKKAILVCPPNK